MTTLWAWESDVPLAGGRGVGEDKAIVLHAAATWMRDHEADRATAEEVVLVHEALDPVYIPRARQPLEATRDTRGRVRWRPQRAG